MIDKLRCRLGFHPWVKESRLYTLTFGSVRPMMTTRLERWCPVCKRWQLDMAGATRVDPRVDG